MGCNGGRGLERLACFGFLGKGLFWCLEGGWFVKGWEKHYELAKR